MGKYICIVLVAIFLAGCGGKDKDQIRAENDFISTHHCVVNEISQSPTGEILTQYGCDNGYQITTSNLNTMSDERSKYYKRDNSQNAAMTGAMVGAMVAGSGRGR